MKTVQFEGETYEVPDWVISIARDSTGQIIGYDAPVTLQDGAFDYWEIESRATRAHPVTVNEPSQELSGLFKSVVYGDNLSFVVEHEAEFAAADGDGMLRWYSKKPLPGEDAFWCAGLSGFVNISVGVENWQQSMGALHQQEWRGDRE